MTPLVDTHCHLALLEDRGLLDKAMESAAEAGVEQVVSIGLDVDDSDRNRQLAERFSGVYFTVGWHPHKPAPPDTAQLAALDELLRHPRAVAVGEIGLDAYWRPGYHDTPLEVQRSGLRLMLELAAAHGKPVVIHDRDAHAEVLDELSSWRDRGGVPEQPLGVMHCFSGDAEVAVRAVALGMLCSFAGTVTFPRSDAVQDAARTLDAGAIVVETDAPFLAPVPHRGRPNLPGYVADTAAAVARLRGVDAASLAAQTTANARRLFRLHDRVVDAAVTH
jgi:TatD DNase family protein